MIYIKKYSLGELEVIYDNMNKETQQWMLDNINPFKLIFWYRKQFNLKCEIREIERQYHLC
jgi:hypothetical protein